MFKLVSKYEPSDDQSQAIEELVKGIEEGKREQVLLGATGTGKTFTINNLENSNAEFIKLGMNLRERLIKLNASARNQMEVLKNNRGIKELEVLQEQINNENNKRLIENK